MICAVNGTAAGAGLDLTTTSDIAIASETATFVDPHVRIGLASGREAVRLARVLPLNVAMRMNVMGKHQRLSAQRVRSMLRSAAVDVTRMDVNGVIVAAAVVAEDPSMVDEADIRARLAQRLSAYKIPRRIRAMTAGHVPMMSSGKLDLPALREGLK